MFFKKSDLELIISRPEGPETLNLTGMCVEHVIPDLFMIDIYIIYYSLQYRSTSFDGLFASRGT